MDKVTCANCNAESSSHLKFCQECGYQLPKPIIENVSPEVPKKVLKKNNPKKTIAATVLGVVTFLIFFYASFQFFSPSYDETLNKMAGDLNQNCPVMVDADTRLDNVGILPGNIVQYNYTLVNMELEMVNPMELRNNMEPFITNLVKTDPAMKFQRDNKITLNYYYQDKNGSYLFLVSVTPDKYLQ